jgi:hypothetical protein
MACPAGGIGHSDDAKWALRISLVAEGPWSASAPADDKTSKMQIADVNY